MDSQPPYKLNKGIFFLILLFATLLLAGCGGRSTKTPVLTPPTSSPITTASPSPMVEETVELSLTLEAIPDNATHKTATASLTPNLNHTPDSHDLLMTRFAGLDGTATARVMTPTPHLAAAPPRPVQPHALSINGSNARQIQLLRKFGSGQVNDLAWSPDGRFLAIAGIDGVQVLEASTLTLKQHLATGRPVMKVAFDTPGDRLAAAVAQDDARGKSSWQVMVEVYRLADGQRQVVMEAPWFNATDYSNILFGEGDMLVGISESAQNWSTISQLITWDASNGKLVSEDHYGYNHQLSIDFNHETGQLLVQDDNASTLFDAATGKWQRLDLMAMKSPILSPDGTKMIGMVAPSNTLYGEMLVSHILSFNSTLACKSLLRSAGRLLCVGDDTVVYIDPITLEPGMVIDLPDEASLVAADNTGQLAWVQEGVIGLWARDMSGQQHFRTLPWQTIGTSTAGTLELNGRQVSVAAGTLDSGEVVVWNLDSGEEMAHLSGNGLAVKAIGFSPDLRSLAWIDADETLFWWDVVNDREINRYYLGSPVGNRLWFSADNQSVYLTEKYGTSLLMLNLGNSMLQPIIKRSMVNPEDGLPIYQLGPAVNYQRSDVFYQEEIQIVRISEGNTGWDSLVFKLPFDLYWNHITGIESSPDGRHLAMAVEGPQMVVYDLQRRASLYQFKSAWWSINEADLTTWANTGNLIAFSPDGRLIASMNPYGECDLWSLTDGSLLLHRYLGRQIAFTPDGHYLVSYGDGAILVWGVP